MLDRRNCPPGHARHYGEALEALGAVVTDPGDRCRGQPHAEQIGHQRGEIALRPAATGSAAGRARRRRSACSCCAGAATQSGKAARVCAPHAAQRQSCARCSVTISGCGSRQVELLPRNMAGGHRLGQQCATPGAGRRIMVDDRIGRLGSTQRLPGWHFLSARLLAGPFAQTADANRLLQPVTRWRLAACCCCSS